MSLTRTQPARSRRALAALLGATILTVAAPSAAFAKGGVEGGATGGTTTCSPVSVLKTRGDARAGETGLATIDVTYSVKPCTSGQAVVVSVTMAESANPAAVVWSDPNAALSGKFTVAGIKIRTSYTVTVTVKDAATGAVLGVKTAFAGAVPSGV